MGQFGERIDLVHQLTQLAAGEEFADGISEWLRINELLRRDGINALVILVDAGLDGLDYVLEAGAALIGQELADVTDATRTQVVDVVDRTVTGTELTKQFRGFDNVLGGDRPSIEGNIQAQLLIEFITSDAAEVISERVLEETLHVCAGSLDIHRLAGAKLAEDFLKGFFLITHRTDIFTEREDDGTVIELSVEDAKLLLRQLFVDFLKRFA